MLDTILHTHNILSDLRLRLRLHVHTQSNTHTPTHFSASVAAASLALSMAVPRSLWPCLVLCALYIAVRALRSAEQQPSKVGERVSPTHFGIVAGPAGLPAALRAVSALVTNPAQLQGVTVVCVTNPQELRGPLDALAAKHKHFSVEYVRGTGGVTRGCLQRCVPRNGIAGRLLVSGDLPLRESVVRHSKALGWVPCESAGSDNVLTLVGRAKSWGKGNSR